MLALLTQERRAQKYACQALESPGTCPCALPGPSPDTRLRAAVASCSCESSRVVRFGVLLSAEVLALRLEVQGKYDPCLGQESGKMRSRLIQVPRVQCPSKGFHSNAVLASLIHGHLPGSGAFELGCRERGDRALDICQDSWRHRRGRFETWACLLYDLDLAVL